MAKTIGQLTQATTLAGADEFIIEQSGLTKRVAASVVRGGLVNADIDAAAAIAHTKLANITAGRVLLGNASNVPTATELTGDVTVSSTGVTAIGSAKVSAPMLTGAQTGSAPIYGCRAWVNFDGTKDTTSAASTSNTNRLIRSSGNVTSVLRNGTGTYTITITTALPDSNYALSGCCTFASGTIGTINEDKANPTRTTTQIRVVTLNTQSVNFYDSDSVSVAIFG
jgi:hypothetical protein